MSSKRVRRETAALVTLDSPNTPGEHDRLRKEINHKNEVRNSFTFAVADGGGDYVFGGFCE